uniref:Uncharacterized protein n=1 Tax=Ditylum brightwellii TaxID=49249 RepID=A0A7S1YSU1_9STRA
MIHGSGGAVAAVAARAAAGRQQNQQQYTEYVEQSLVLYQYDVEYRTPAPTSASIPAPASNNSSISREMRLLLAASSNSNGKTKQKSAGTWRKMESEMEELALLQFSPSTIRGKSLVGGEGVKEEFKMDLSLIQQAALSSLRNPMGKFVCDYHSSQTGKKYRFDFMDGSTSKGVIPRYESYPKPPQEQQQQQSSSSSLQSNYDEEEYDPLRESKKVLCLTIIQDAIESSSSPLSSQTDLTLTQQQSLSGGLKKDVSTISLTLDGPLKNPLNLSFFPASSNPTSSPSLLLGSINGSGSYQDFLSSHFRILRAAPASMESLSSPVRSATSPSGQILLLHPDERGRVYVDGIYVATLSSDNNGKQKITEDNNFLPLFGFDLKGVSILRGAAAGPIPSMSSDEEKFKDDGRIMNEAELKWVYSRLLQEVLIDASQLPKNVAGLLYNRLNINQDHDNDDDSYMKHLSEHNDMDESFSIEGGLKKNNNGSQQRRRQVQQELRSCIESEIMSDARYDPVGIAARALAIHFSKIYGKDAYPCEEGAAHEVEKRLVGKKPIVVSHRLLQVLSRGGYFDVGKMEAYEWFSPDASGRRTEYGDIVVREGKGSTKNIVFEEAIRMLLSVGCPAEDVAMEKIVLLNKEKDEQNYSLSMETLSHRSICKYNETEGKFYVNDLLFSLPLSTMDELILSGVGQGDTQGDKASAPVSNNHREDVMTRAFLLGFFIAQEHKDGSILLRFILKHGVAKKG